MSIKKSLLALGVLAIAMMGFASSAMAATDGVVKDVTNGEAIPANRVLHFVGWAKFETSRTTYECHVTSEAKFETPSTGKLMQFTIPDTTKCAGGGLDANCKLKKHEITNLPYHLTVTPPNGTQAGDFDVTGTIVIHDQLEGFLCPTETTLTFSAITLKPLNTEHPRPVTGTSNRIGDTITTTNTQAIAGVEISGTGTLHGTFGEEAATITGELELSSAAERCTWRLAVS